MQVSIISENSYPVNRGGVSEWCSSLISGLPDICFNVFTIAPDKKLRYDIPENLVGVDVTELSRPCFMETQSHTRETVKIMELLKPVLKGMPLDCLKMLKLMENTEFTAEELISSKENLRLLEAFYQQNYEGNPFVPFYYSWISLFYLLFKTLELYNRLPKAGVIHALNSGYAGLLGSLAKVREGNPLVVSEHGLYLKERRFELRHSEVEPWLHGLYIAFFTGLVKTSYKYSDVVTSVCRDHVSHQKSIDPSIEPKVIYNGIDVNRFGFNNHVNDHGCYVVGTISRVTPIKDQLTFIRSAPQILEKHDTKFYVVGQIEDQEYFDECNQLIRKLNLEDSFKFTGFQDSAEWYPRFDVFVLSSLSEGFPLTLLEAMSSGVPCVSTDVGGVGEVLRKEFLVPRWDPKSLAAKVSWLLEDEAKRELVRHYGRKLVEKRFSVDAMASEYRDIYEGLV